jgi:hypothetical protein
MLIYRTDTNAHYGRYVQCLVCDRELAGFKRLLGSGYLPKMEMLSRG